MNVVAEADHSCIAYLKLWQIGWLWLNVVNFEFKVVKIQYDGTSRNPGIQCSRRIGFWGQKFCVPRQKNGLGDLVFNVIPGTCFLFLSNLRNIFFQDNSRNKFFQGISRNKIFKVIQETSFKWVDHLQYFMNSN